MTESPPTITAERGLEVLCQVIQAAERKKPGEGASIQRKIGLHLKALTGQTVLLAGYHNNDSITDDEKITCYKDCVRAITCGNFSVLKGQNESNGRSDPLAHIDVETAVRLTTAEPPLATPGPVRRNTLLPERVEVKSSDEPEDELTRLLLKRMEPYLKPQAVEGPIDEEKVKEIIETCLSNGSFPEDRVRKLIDERLGGHVAKLHIVTEFTERSVEGCYHWQLPQLITWVNADVPLWLWGQAGGGKTHLGRQIAAALDLNPIIASIDPTTTVGKLLGYRNLANGEFVEGWLYRPFKDGGLIMLDEIDTGDPGILAALNALLANGHYLFPNGETVQRHPKLRVMAGANTRGCGAVAGYTARNRLDAATLNRFAIIELAYDQELETALALGNPKQGGKVWVKVEPIEKQSERWIAYVQAARAKVGSSVLISPRASILGVRALRAGIPAQEVAEALLFGLMAADTRQTVLRSVPNELGIA